MKSQMFDAASSKILQRKWKEREIQIHKRRLESVKSSIGQNQMNPYSHANPSLLAAKKAKKEVQAEQRYTEIERENRILLEKMSNIMQTSKPQLYAPPNVVNVKKSLNRNQRKQEFLKITQENEKILKRLQKKTATYSVNRWENQFKKNQLYSNQLSEQPYEYGASSHIERNRMSTATESNMRTQTIDPNNQESPQNRGRDIVLPRIGTGGSTAGNGTQGKMRTLDHVQQRTNLQSQKHSSQARKRFDLPIINQAQGLHDNRIVLYKKRKNLGEGYYVVEISSWEGNLCLAAFDTKSPESLLIELPENRAQHILNEFKNNYDFMSNSLQVMKKRLVLLNPKYNQAGMIQPQHPQENENQNQNSVFDQQNGIGTQLLNQQNSDSQQNLHNENSMQEMQEIEDKSSQPENLQVATAHELSGTNIENINLSPQQPLATFTDVQN